MKYNINTLHKLETVFKELEYTLRYEKGNFLSGFCILEDQKTIILNKFLNIEGKINTLIELLNHPDINTDVSAEQNTLSMESRKILKQTLNAHTTQAVQTTFDLI